MLSRFFNKRKLQILAPVKGEMLPLEQVPDPVFSEKMMGDGVAIMPEDGGIHSPIEGTVILVADTKHAIGIRANDGTELLIHIGLETVSLHGKGFETLVETGDSVSIGQLLIEVDWKFVKENATSIITPIIITNSAEKQIQLEPIKKCNPGETVLMTVTPK
ncbi:PTS glucose transporter subunit IIA [Cytobacillus solani]|uniref:PTS glucose transporter subunit IIA n=1 Tax=Cytobacillus solani TaxID=1637975 RepID=A0A0Q3VKH9_9BACI|nr:PTS glucose transporter subunit IIA [Cytobacillus solani]KOP71248.1 PTS glucose transporter subunit IIA [Bacillus sp. FJAT-21945]KQL21775.1 PTS glucose transporter subunit IIA [Cytobacillus solani]USK55624.1 PTS glucose transporter subunit IIA [Cytobacillus solani]